MPASVASAAGGATGSSTPVISDGAMTPQDMDMDDILAPTATKHLSDKKFSDFPILPALLQGIPFERCTEGELLPQSITSSSGS